MALSITKSCYHLHAYLKRPAGKTMALELSVNSKAFLAVPACWEQVKKYVNTKTYFISLTYSQRERERERERTIFFTHPETRWAITDDMMYSQHMHMSYVTAAKCKMSCVATYSKNHVPRHEQFAGDLMWASNAWSGTYPGNLGWRRGNSYVPAPRNHLLSWRELSFVCFDLHSNPVGVACEPVVRQPAT